MVRGGQEIFPKSNKYFIVCNTAAILRATKNFML